MQADAIPLEYLYTTLNKGYVIPGYQRPFAWNSDKAIELLDSILEDFEAKEKMTSLGTLLFCNIKFENNQNPYSNNSPKTNAPSTLWEVVDGQQRLTVLSMIGYNLKVYFNQLISRGLQDSPDFELELFYSTSKKKSGVTVPLIIRDIDNYDNGYNSDISNLLNSYISSSSLNSTDRLNKVSKSIYEWVESKLTERNFVEFCNYLVNNCQIIQVIADDQNSAFMMFEPLNSTSEPLTAFEVYRSKAIRLISPSPSFERTLDLLDYSNNSRDIVIKNSNSLIFNISQVFSGKRPKIGFVQLKKYLDNNINSNFISVMEDSAYFFSYIWNNQLYNNYAFDDEAKLCIRFLKFSKHDVSIPLILRYFINNSQDISKITKIIVAFYSLWRCISLTNNLPNIYRNLFENQFNNISIENGKIKSVESIAQYFREQLKNKLVSLGGINDIESIWNSQDVQKFLNYESLKTICRLFIFIDIGSSIKNNLIPDDPWTSLDDVEHILAKNTINHPLNINDLGNLTFLPGTINKSIKDMTWDKKREIYSMLADTQKPSIPITTFLDGTPLPKAVQNYLNNKGAALIHLNMISQEVIWDEVIIHKRSKAMLKRVWDVLYKQWLHP